MALVIADRVRETTSSSGTGTVTLTGAFSGFQPFSTIGNGNNTYYCIIDTAVGAWEVGIGTYTASGNTLSRDTVLSSSNSDALVPFATGIKDVICTQPAERAVYARAAGTGLAVGTTAFTANGVPYADSASTLATSANMVFNGTTLTSAFAGPHNGTVGASTPNTGAFTTLTTSSLTVNSLTNTRVPYASTSGLLVDSANMVFNGTRLTVADLADAGLTSGRVTYASTGGALVDSANLTFDGTTLTSAFAGPHNGTVGATTANTGTFTVLTATSDSAFTSTGALTISKGNTAARPTPVSGMLRFNTQTTEFEGYNGTAWASVGGAALSNDTSTATNVFPLFASATTGTASTLFTSNAQYLFKPSTGELSVKAPRASNGIVVNSATISSDYTIATGDNGMSAGPVSVNSGITVTVSSGSTWVVV